MEPRYTIDDAVAAAEALREISSGHEDAAAALLSAAGLDGLNNEELEILCDGSAWRLDRVGERPLFGHVTPARADQLPDVWHQGSQDRTTDYPIHHFRGRERRPVSSSDGSAGPRRVPDSLSGVWPRRTR